MDRIFTITCNLLAETTLKTPSLPQKGSTLRASEEVFRTGGKGVNAAKAFSALGGRAFALIFPSGEVGERCKRYLEKKAFAKIIDVQTRGQTRIGVVLKTPDGAETTVLGADRPLPFSAFKRGLGLIEKNASEKDAVALCGSIPGWTDSFGKAFMKLIASKELKAVIDTYGAPLKFFAKQEGLWALKINAYEFAQLFGRDLSSIGDFGEFFRANAPKIRARNIVVTNGKDKIEALIGGRFSRLTPRKADVVSATGCGDVFTAVLARFLDTAGPSRALRAAMLAAAASAESEEIAEFSKAQKRRILSAAHAAKGR